MATTFEDLPNEIILTIFSFFTPFQLSRTISLVCKDWWILSEDPHLWIQVILGLTDHNVNDQSVERISSRLRQCTMLEQLSIKDNDNSFLHYRLEIPSNLFPTMGSISSLKALLFYNVFLRENILIQIIETYPLIERLTFYGCTIYVILKEFLTRFSALVNLREFNLYINSDICVFDDSCLEVLSRSCPKLESLSIRGGKITDKGVAELAMNCNKTLQKLILDCTGDGTLNNGSVHLASCQNLIFLKLEGVQLGITYFKALSELPLLKTFHLIGMLLQMQSNQSNVESMDRMEKGFEIFFSNPFRAKLTDLSITYHSFGQSALINMSQTCTNLEELCIFGCLGITDSGVRELFAKCSKFKRVSIKCCKSLLYDYKAKLINNVLSVIKSQENRFLIY